MHLQAIEERQREEAKAEKERLTKERDDERTRAQQQLADAETKHEVSFPTLLRMR